MKRLAAIIVFLSLATSSSFAATDLPYPNIERTALIQPMGDSFTFVALGDTRPARRDIPYPEAFIRIMEEVGVISPSFVVSTGDSYYGYGGSSQRFKNEVARFVSRAKSAGVPFYNIIGNHEVAGDADRERYAKEIFGKFYGSFDYGSSHFIALNTEERGQEGSIAGAQMEWLKKDLAANRDARNIFVFLHRPLYSVTDPDFTKGKSFKDRASRDALHDIFRENKVKAVFEGHEHLYDDRTVDGVRYIIAGGGGAPLVKDASQGGFYQYLVVKVNGGSVEIGTIAPKALQLRTISGNDGFEPKAEIEAVNVSNTNLPAGNITFVMPADKPGRYRAGATSMTNLGVKSDHPVRITKVRDNGDGTSTVSVGTLIEGNGYLRITVESDVDK